MADLENSLCMCPHLFLIKDEFLVLMQRLSKNTTLDNLTELYERTNIQKKFQNRTIEGQDVGNF